MKKTIFFLWVMMYLFTHPLNAAKKQSSNPSTVTKPSSSVKASNPVKANPVKPKPVKASNWWALTGGFGAASITWLGPITTAHFKGGVGAEYWFNKNSALGFDVGMGSGGYGKVIGTTTQSMVNLKSGLFIVDPGLSVTLALNPMGHAKLYAGLRLGLPLRSGFPPAFSIGPSLGALIMLNEHIALDLAANFSAVANFKFTYLASILTVGSIGFRVFL